MATNAVPDAVEENFESFSKESACANDDCTEAEEDWASSTGQRDFYGYSITNVADVMANGTAPTYEKIGPVTYEITTTRTITGYDATAGELTYNSVKSFECAEDTVVSCDTDVSQLNIAFQTQVIGATGLAMGGIMDLTKIGFAVQMVLQDMNTTQAGTATVGDLCMADTDDDGALDMQIPCHTWASGAQISLATSATGMGIMALNNDAALNNTMTVLSGSPTVPLTTP